MNFNPQNFFIGLMDFFSMLLPGALLTYHLIDTTLNMVIIRLGDILLHAASNDFLARGRPAGQRQRMDVG